MSQMESYETRRALSEAQDILWYGSLGTSNVPGSSANATHTQDTLYFHPLPRCPAICVASSIKAYITRVAPGTTIFRIGMYTVTEEYPKRFQLLRNSALRITTPATIGVVSIDLPGECVFYPDTQYYFGFVRQVATNSYFRGFSTGGTFSNRSIANITGELPTMVPFSDTTLALMTIATVPTVYYISTRGAEVM